MDLRNVIFAIALSFAVLFGWSVIFETPQIEEQNKSQQTQRSQKTDKQTSDAPSVNFENNKALNISREDAINTGKRIKFENENVKGSISLKGALIDDITFKNYKDKLGSDKNVTYLNPAETNDGYFVEGNIGSPLSVYLINDLYPDDNIFPDLEKDTSIENTTIEDLQLLLFQKDQKIKFRDGQLNKLKKETNELKINYKNVQ